jgi:probable HAF family extracellular repeat protein
MLAAALRGPSIHQHEVHAPMHVRVIPLLAAAALAGLGASAVAGDAPRYHLSALTIPGALGVYVADVNNAGQAVGYYINAEGINQAFLYANGQPHTLPRPADRDEAMATGINDAGQIVGYASTITDDGALTTALLWNAADLDAYTVIGNDQGNKLNPDDINASGVVVGLASRDGSFRAFSWSQASGLADDGVPDHGEATNAYWTAINNAGQIVGGWNFPFSVSHATTGQFGVSGISAIAAGVDDVASMAHDINEANVGVGEMDVDGSGRQVPVTFSNGQAAAIPGALLGLTTGSAFGINESGVIVGRTQNFLTLSFKAFVFVDGTAYDLLQQSDGSAGFPYLLRASAVNDSGVIVGVGRVGDFDVGSFIATPFSDGLFADAFDP